MTDLDKRINGLSPSKRALLELKLKRRSLSTPDEQTISKRGDGDLAPLSYAQQRMWFMEEMNPGSSAYNVPRAVRVEGKLDLRALREAINEVVARHEVLRTSFVTVGGEPRQRVLPARAVHVAVTDLSEVGVRAREAEALRVVREQALEGFDLREGEVFRASVVRESEREHILLLSMHHIVSDGWSGGVLYRELGALYESFGEGKPSPFEPLAIQYADYAVWERQQMQSEAMQAHLAYWTQKLGDELPVLDLPTDHLRPAVQSGRGARQRFMLSAALTESLKELGRREGATLYMTLLAAFQTLLHRYTGQPDIIVGSLIANRDRVETEGLIGFFINALPMRVNLAGGPSFRALLGRVRETALQAYAHQYLPFEKLVEVLQPERILSRAPLFQVMFNHQNAPKETLQLKGLRVEPLRVGLETTGMDLTLAVAEGENGLIGSFEYSTDLFEAETINRMITHFQTLLEGLTAGLDQPIAKLPLLSDAELGQLLLDWNDTARDHPVDQCFHQLFQRQVERSPHSVAVSYHKERLTYDELNRRANRLARLLVRQGVGPDVIIGLIFERSAEFLTAIVAILKAGGAYLPIDPLQPASRIRQVIEQSRSGILLTTGEFARSLAEACEGVASEERPRVLRVEELIEQDENEENLPACSTPKNLAFVTFTSGSTGVPKGAMVEHAGMVNHLYAKITDLRLTARDTIAHTAPQSFVISVWQFLAALIVGGQVHILDDDAAHDPERLWQEAERERVTVIEVVPSLLREMLKEATKGRARRELVTLRWMVATGEALPPDLVYRWLDAYPQIPLLNAYGSTECSDDVAHYAIDGAVSTLGAHTPVGRPVSNIRLYILDNAMSPVPIGVTGELYVGGVGVGRGYFNDVIRTAEVFIPDPFSLKPGERLYKTGDRARHVPGGKIEYLGRLDHQVKIRGNRIELGEIEATLAAHPAVGQVVAVVRKDAQGDNSLVAYVVPEQKHVAAISELRSYVKDRLPEYMVPSAIVGMRELPLTPNGKLDRRALPPPEQTRAELQSQYEAPGTPVEKLLVEMFGELIGVERVSIHDNFFEMGGHSLLATQVISRVRHSLKVDLPLRAIFERPTAAELAGLIEQKQAEKQGKKESKIKAVSRGQEMPLSFAQQRMWFMEEMNPGSSAYNVPRAVRVEGKLDLCALREAINEVVARHEVLRTSFVTVDGHPRQVIARAMKVMLPLIDLTHLSDSDREAEAKTKADWEVQRPFELDKAPLLRTVLLRLGEEEHILVVTMHHIISDGHSVDVFLREMCLLYGAFTRREPSPLAPLAVQYADYAAWERGWMESGGHLEQLRYWRRKLGGAPRVIELATDRARPAVRSFRGGREGVRLSGEVTDRLKGLSKRCGATLNMVVLASYEVLLRRYSGQGEVMVGTAVGRRDRGEVEGMIGILVNTVVMRGDVRGDPRFEELVERVRVEAVEAYGNGDVPFEKVVEEVRPERDLSHNPLFQVWFVLQNAPMRQLDMGGLKLTSIGLNRSEIRHDLQLSLWETPEGLRGSLEYSTDLFNPGTITKMARTFERLLEYAVAHPDARISALQEMLDDADRQQQVIKEKQIEESALRRFKNIRRTAISG